MTKGGKHEATHTSRQTARAAAEKVRAFFLPQRNSLFLHQSSRKTQIGLRQEKASRAVRSAVQSPFWSRQSLRRGLAAAGTQAQLYFQPLLLFQILSGQNAQESGLYSQKPVYGRHRICKKLHAYSKSRRKYRDNGGRETVHVRADGGGARHHGKIPQKAGTARRRHAFRRQLHDQAEMGEGHTQGHDFSRSATSFSTKKRLPPPPQTR